MREGDAAFEALRETIEKFAIERAPGVVAEAREEAVGRVRSMLSDAIAHSLLDQARTHLDPGYRAPPSQPASPTPAPTPAPTPTPTRTEAPRSEHGWYVYGVAWADAADIPAELPGVDERRPVTRLEHDGLVAAVSRVSLAEFGEEELRENLNDVKWLEDKARAHERVLEEILARTTVVPMRLCTIYRSEQQVREMLGRERDIFAEALGRLEGRTEWAVKLIAEPGALARAAAASESGGHDESALAPGAAYMRDRRLEARTREEMDEIAEDWAGAVHERLASRASEALVNPLQNPEVSGHTGDMLLNGVYLVDDTGVDAFRDVVDGLEREYRALGASVELSGPWPPYNFVKGSIEAAR